MTEWGRTTLEVLVGVLCVASDRFKVKFKVKVKVKVKKLKLKGVVIKSWSKPPGKGWQIQQSVHFKTFATVWESCARVLSFWRKTPRLSVSLPLPLFWGYKVPPPQVPGCCFPPLATNAVHSISGTISSFFSSHASLVSNLFIWMGQVQDILGHFIKLNQN